MAARAAAWSRGERLAGLTERELQVLHLLAEGLSNKEIALALAITERTVKAHLSSIYEKLGVSDRLALAVLLPFTFTLPPLHGLVALGAVYMGAIYGGSFAAILVNTPGTPSSIATAFEGYPMSKQGRALEAISIATVSSAIGGIAGALFLLLLSLWIRSA